MQFSVVVNLVWLSLVLTVLWWLLFFFDSSSPALCELFLL